MRIFLIAVVNTYLTFGAPIYNALYDLARIGLTIMLYLIGSHISLATLRQTGVRPLAQDVILWIIISALSLWLIVQGFITL